MELLIPVGLVAAGLLLIAAEVYLIPGLNVFGILGLILVVFGVGYVFAESGFLGGTVALVGSVGAGGLLFWALWQTGAWDRFVLSTTLGRGSGSDPREADQRSSLLGKEGVALTPLRPTGVAEIDGRRVEVVTEGEFIASGSGIRVVAMDRRRHFVRLSSVAADAAPTPSP